VRTVALGLLLWGASASGAEPRSWIALGDVHGDVQAARRALCTAGVVDAQGHWSGGTAHVVQVGDQLDRGQDERQVLDWFRQLEGEAAAAGGAFVVLLGNHELMNAALDLRYVTPKGFSDFADVPLPATHPLAGKVAAPAQGRVAAFSPGGPYALMLADHPVIHQWGDTVFVHGGLLPQHVELGVEAINTSASLWLRGQGPAPTWNRGETSPLWDRTYGDAPTLDQCTTLRQTLAALGAQRLVVAHTVQRGGISSACDGVVWRVDTGMSAHYGGVVQVLFSNNGYLQVFDEKKSTCQGGGLPE